MDAPKFYTVFDYNSIPTDIFKKTKCCKKYKKKGKFNCHDCPKL
jgi:ferric iron reductase protein FhuF